MSNFFKGLHLGWQLLHWLLNLASGIMGFLLPFIAAFGLLMLAIVIIVLISEIIKGKGKTE